MDILSDPNPLSQETSTGVNSKQQYFQKFQYFYVNLR